MESLRDAVHVYRLNLAEFHYASYERACLLLEDDERERATRFRHAPSKRAFVQVRSALRVLLGGYLRLPPAAIRFDLGEKGKPRLAGTAPDQGLVFNVSHSGDCGLLAFAWDTSLGVDVERCRAIAHVDGIAERCFAPAELAWWRGLPDARREQSFFKLWTCKEAFVKATGEGITLGLESCIVALASQPPNLLSIPPHCGLAEDWRLAEIDAGEGHQAALCYRGKQRSLRVTDAARFVTDSLNIPGWV
jgi:4'-phosphopantetheinyl transferase